MKGVLLASDPGRSSRILLGVRCKVHHADVRQIAERVACKEGEITLFRGNGLRKEGRPKGLGWLEAALRGS